jgi:SpoVK/Ycf46/Vps4 family AAA+-type ATPase
LLVNFRLALLFKRASDLLSPWVGENEQNIAKAFEEAKEKESFLVFDEADSLLSDRRYAQRSWEVSQVNEMLTWMECHPLPFACTTNLKERLDQASMRRFTFKCHFGYMETEQVIIAFKHFFNLKLDFKNASTLCNLTPGDFAVVSKKLKFIGEEPDLTMLINLLSQEVEAKNEVRQRHIGFV